MLLRSFVLLCVVAIIVDACHPYRTLPRKRPCRGRKGKNCFYRNKSGGSSKDVSGKMSSGEVVDNCTADCKGYSLAPSVKCPKGKTCSTSDNDLTQDIVDGCMIISCPDGYKLGAYGDETDVLDFSTTEVQCQKGKWYGGKEGDIPFGKSVIVVCYKI